MSYGNKLSNVWTSVLRSGEGLTSFDKNTRVNFSGEKKLKWSFSCCPFWEYIDYEFLVLRAKRTRHENDHARDWRRETGEARSRARSLPSLNLKKKRDCSQSSREIHGSQIDLFLAVVLVLGSEGLYLCTEEEGLLALALVTYLRAYISIKHTCDVGSLNYDNIMTPSGWLPVCVSLSIFIT